MLFARQPIFDRNLSVVGYELLFRDSASDDTVPEKFDGDRATSEVLLNAFIESTIEAVCEGKPVFINMTRQRLGEWMPFSPRHVVLELLETLTWEPDLGRDLDRLQAQGYKLALDDFVIDEMASPLLSYASIVKLEFPALSQEQLVPIVTQLRQVPVQVLAEKLETKEDFRRCMEAGCDFFQGYFLARPGPVRGRTLPNNRISVLRLLAAVNSAETELEDITALFRQDSVLSLKLLRVINSAALRRAVEVTSINTAVLMLGLNRIRAFASMLALTKLEDRPHALQALALTRARFCELLAVRGGLPDANAAFTVGMFSCLDAFFELPLTELLTQIPLHHSVREAIIDRKGRLGLLLDTALNCERGEWDDLQWSRLAQLRLDAVSLTHEYRESLAWVSSVLPG